MYTVEYNMEKHHTPRLIDGLLQYLQNLAM